MRREQNLIEPTLERSLSKMTIFDLLFSSEASNVKSVRRAPHSIIFLAFICTKCGEKTKDIGICPEDKVEIPNSRGDTNMHYTCKGCNSRCNVDILNESAFIPEEAAPTGTRVATVECRGSLQPLKWCYDQMIVTSISGAEMKAPGNEPVWCDYDETLEEQIELTEMRFTVQ